MDAKITLAFDKQVIERAKQYADSQNISLSRLTEFLYSRLTSHSYSNLEDLPVADWVNMVAEGQAEYRTKPRNRKSTKSEFMKSRK